jgi:hypothetical protein
MHIYCTGALAYLRHAAYFRHMLSGVDRHPASGDTPGLLLSRSIRVAGKILRALFILILIVVTARVASPQNERLWSIYETPSDLVRLVARDPSVHRAQRRGRLQNMVLSRPGDPAAGRRHHDRHMVSACAAISAAHHLSDLPGQLHRSPRIVFDLRQNSG